MSGCNPKSDVTKPDVTRFNLQAFGKNCCARSEKHLLQKTATMFIASNAALFGGVCPVNAPQGLAKVIYTYRPPAFPPVAL
eukprot:921564-Amphidinium_carterae.1